MNFHNLLAGHRKFFIILFSVIGVLIGLNIFKTIMIKAYFAHYSPPPQTVSSVTVSEKPWSPLIPSVGNFVAENGVDIAAQTSGNVTKISFQSGQTINKDAPLIDLDDNIDKATLKFNQAQATLSKLDFLRQQDLIKKGATSRSSLDTAAANLAQAEANVEKTQAEISHKHISAPFSGLLGIRRVNLGQYVSAGQTTIVTLQSLDPLFLEFYIPEQQVKNIRVGQTIRFSTEEFDPIHFLGKITAINAKIDTNTHNILVQATISNCDIDTINALKSKKQKADKIDCSNIHNNNQHIHKYAFIPGMFARVEIEEPSNTKALLVPTTAISYSMYGNSVYILQKDEQHKQEPQVYTAERTYVQTGPQTGNMTVIEKGLKAGDLVVSVGEMKLQNGAKVIINNDIELNQTLNADNSGE